MPWRVIAWGRLRKLYGRPILTGDRFEAADVKEVRSDVYYRLNVIALYLPPLRERRDDIPMLAYRFLGSLVEREGERTLGEDILEVLCAYDWPGNVRELENALERAAAVAPKP